MTTASAVVARWARGTEHRLRETLRQAAQDVAENVSVGGAYSPGTPYDTGFASINWDATLDTPPSEPLTAPKGAKSGDFDRNAGAESMALVIASADITDTITLYNNTVYLPYIEDGSTKLSEKSRAAGYRSGWIAETVQAWPTIVSRAEQAVKDVLG